MGRERIGGRSVLVQFADGVTERIDACCGSGGRSRFIREAVDAALLAGEAAPAKSPPSSGSPKISPPPAKALTAESELLSAVRGMPMNARQASVELGWPELRVEKAAAKLVAGGLLHFPRGGGVMEAVA